jgi:S1-C subfamily serine protease
MDEEESRRTTPPQDEAGQGRGAQPGSGGEEDSCGPPAAGDWKAWCSARIRRVGWGQVIITAVITTLVVLLLFPLFFGVNPYDLVRGKVSGVTQKVTVVASPANSSDVAVVAQNVTKSVVNIDVRGVSSPTTTSATPTAGVASGVIYKENGYIITNDHVAGTATSIVVTLSNGKRYQGTRVGTDPSTDIAVVKIDATGLPAVKIGDSDRLVVGQLVVAIGSSLGFEDTVTSGIVSALNRSVKEARGNGRLTRLDGLIQTDATINPGNSGGALCDASSRLIGINAVIASGTGGSQGIAFAIPAKTAIVVADRIISGK